MIRIESNRTVINGPPLFTIIVFSCIIGCGMIIGSGITESKQNVEDVKSVRASVITRCLGRAHFGSESCTVMLTEAMKSEQP